MTYKVLKFVFYGLLLLPIVVIGFYFFVRLCRNIGQIKRTDKLIKEELAKAEESQRYEKQKMQNFFDDYDKSKGYR